MTQTRTPAVAAAVLRRIYRAPREQVFAAWTTPAIAARFLGPDDVKAIDVKMDVREGGTYSIGMQRADGETWFVKGVYREVRAPDRISMTWRWEEDDPADEIETLLTIEFNDLNGQTGLVLTHEQFATVESREGHLKGWTSILDNLPDVL